MILFLVESPTPHHTPVLNRLSDELREDVCVYYLRGTETSRGWGGVTVSHPCVVLDHVGAWTTLGRGLLCARLDAICLFGYKGVPRVAAAVAARLRGIPLVLRGEANIRDELSRPWLRRLLKRWYLRTLLGQPEVWTNGSANTAYWDLLGLRRRHLIPYALQHMPGGEDEAPALRAALDLDRRFVFTFVGRLEPIKGITELLHAYDMVRQTTPAGTTALLIAGRGSLEPEVRHYVSTREDCRYLGAVAQDRLGAVYAASDVFVVPSHREPWGWVVNEALGFGTRVIASEAVASADDLCTEETGRRCPVSDPHGLATALLAEYQQGARRAARLPSVDTASAMADRLRRLARPRESAETHRR
jgi:glycosyltransferase involved in cell wall biosynthesis